MNMKKEWSVQHIAGSDERGNFDSTMLYSESLGVVAEFQIKDQQTAQAIAELLNERNDDIRHKISHWSFTVSTPTESDPFASSPLKIVDIGVADRLIRFEVQ